MTQSTASKQSRASPLADLTLLVAGGAQAKGCIKGAAVGAGCGQIYSVAQE